MNWKSILDKAYTPYSKSPKACVVESEKGNLYVGVRVENISYPITISAIQAACSICLSEGEIPSKVYVQNQPLSQFHFWVHEFNLEVIETEGLPNKPTANLLHTLNPDMNVSQHLKDLLGQAVVPNSDFPVSCLLFTENGYFEGVNVEVSDWSQGLCAERVAISKAIAAGFRSFTGIEVHTKKGEVSSPCGACRQVIAEHLPYNNITLHHSDDTVSEHITIDLLPLNFKSSILQK
ncbi:cytidine deaminase [Gracilimonas sp.]|uniref:cytidine deaminase n=1 Tax=Gracilimonas sp. TaxID=1974203 RepID=UPI002871A367|nr:cytidine deaminase [Gracilimonas sp.]